MIKSVTVCFRTNKELRNVLENISKQERRSVSSVIESILYQFLEGTKEGKHPEKEKRRFARKKVTVPALIRQVGEDGEGFRAGVVLDISLGGLQIAVPDTFELGIHKDKDDSRISVVLTLPDGNKAISVECVPKHITPGNEDNAVGASFTNADFESYQALQDYLIN